VSERFYAPGPYVDRVATLDADEAHHLARVSRHGPGDLVEVFDGLGAAWTARVESVGRDRATLALIDPIVADDAPRFTLILATAVPKGERFGWLVEKATEIGVTCLVPLVFRRSVVEPGSAKLDRLRRRVIEACKQSRRARIMELDSPRAATQFLTAPRPGLRCLADRGGQRPAGRATDGIGTLVVGPEGGVDDRERELAAAHGWSTFGLGPTVLRTETAGLVGAARLLAMAEGDDP